MDRNVAGIRISRALKELENQLDELLTSAGRLSADVSEARVHFEESALSTQRAIARLGSISQLLIQARSKACGVHADLAKVAAGSRDFPMQCPAGCLSVQPVTAAEWKEVCKMGGA